MVCWRPRFFGVWNSGTALKKIIGPWKLWQPTVWNSLFNNFFGGKLLVFRSVSPCASDSTPHRRLMLGIIQGLLGELFVTLGDVTWILNDLCMFLVWGATHQRWKAPGTGEFSFEGDRAKVGRVVLQMVSGPKRKLQQSRWATLKAFGSLN